MSNGPALPEEGCPQLQFPTPGAPARARWSCSKSARQADCTAGQTPGPRICVKLSSFWNDLPRSSLLARSYPSVAGSPHA